MGTSENVPYAINAPLHSETEGLFGDELLATMKRRAYLINTARAKIVDQDAIDRALPAGSWRATRETSGTPSPPPPTTPGAPCRTTE